MLHELKAIERLQLSYKKSLCPSTCHLDGACPSPAECGEVHIYQKPLRGLTVPVPFSCDVLWLEPISCGFSLYSQSPTQCMAHRTDQERRQGREESFVMGGWGNEPLVLEKILQISFQRTSSRSLFYFCKHSYANFLTLQALARINLNNQLGKLNCIQIFHIKTFWVLCVLLCFVAGHGLSMYLLIKKHRVFTSRGSTLCMKQ